MTPINKRKFNKPSGKTKYFPIPQHRFDVTWNPIFLSKEKRSFKIKSILSQQEELMLIALSKSLQVPIDTSVRIALSKLSTIDSKDVEKSIGYILAQSKYQGHTARNRKYEVRLPGKEKAVFKEIARTYRLSEQETFRLIIYHIQKSITSGAITEFDNSRKLTDEECWDAWCRDVGKSSGKLNPLKKARDKGMELSKQRQKEIYDLRGIKIQELIDKQMYLHKNEKGDIDVTWIDQLIECDQREQDEDAWEEYVKSIQIKDEKDLLIKQHMFRMERWGFDISKDEIIEYVEEEVKQENKMSEEELENLTNQFFEELEQERITDSYEFVASKLGEGIKDLTYEQVKRLREEIELIEKKKKEIETLRAHTKEGEPIDLIYKRNSPDPNTPFAPPKQYEPKSDPKETNS